MKTGMPTKVVYVLASTVVPVLSSMGVTASAGPVRGRLGLPGLTGRTGWIAFKMALSAFGAPFAFVRSPRSCSRGASPKLRRPLCDGACGMIRPGGRYGEPFDRPHVGVAAGRDRRRRCNAGLGIRLASRVDGPRAAGRWLVRCWWRGWQESTAGRRQSQRHRHKTHGLRTAPGRPQPVFRRRQIFGQTGR